MKNTTNVFLEGIITDQNPLTMPENAVTSALNAAIITGNGNEGLLQNDMGNTLIKDSITGNIMSLNNGFIPLGMKERGGVLYIASYNPKTNEGELGTIPSPIIHYTYTTHADEPVYTRITDISNSSDSDVKVSDTVNKAPIYILSDHTFHAGDKFIVILNIDRETSNETTKYWHNVNSQIGSHGRVLQNNAHTFPQISTINKRGWFKIKLYAVDEAGNMTELDHITNQSQEYYLNNSNVRQSSDYWFIESNKLLDNFNINKTRTNNLFKTYPNIRSGKLAIQFEEELPDKLTWLENESFGKNLPQICYLIKTDSSDLTKQITTYYGIVHGLQYNNGLCPIMPDKIEVSCNFPMYVTLYSGTTSLGNDKLYELNIFPNTELGTLVIYNDFPNYPDNTTLAAPKAYFFQDKNENTKFIIHKHLPTQDDEYESYLSYSNYDNEKSDGLFFIELEDLSKEVQVKVKLYTKTFDGTDYILYDEYYLPKFIPLVEMGGTSLEVTKKADQYLDILKDKHKKFDLNLFNNSVNACFLYDDEDILKYQIDPAEWEYGTYVKKENDTINGYANMRSYIYPIIKAVGSVSDHDAIKKGNDDESVFFYWSGIEEDYSPYNMGTIHSDFKFLGNDLSKWSEWDSLGNVLSSVDLDLMPTVKLATQPLGAYDDGGSAAPRLFPFETESKKSQNKKIASRMKRDALNFVNVYNLNYNDLKKYCIFNTNLECLKNELIGNNRSNDGVNQYFTSQVVTGGRKDSYTRNQGEEKFFVTPDVGGTGELRFNSWGSSNQDYSLTSLKNLPIQSLADYSNPSLPIHTWARGNTYWGYSDIEVEYGYGRPSNGWYDPKEFRGYAIGSIYRYVNNQNTYDVCSSFLTFMIASTPGFILADKSTTLFDLTLIDYKYPLNYLYNQDPVVHFVNMSDGPAVTTVNYLGSGYTYTAYNHGTDAGNWYSAVNTFNNHGLYQGYSYQFLTQFYSNGSEITNLKTEYKGSKLASTAFNDYSGAKDVLGITKNPVDVTIPSLYSNFNLKTQGLITPKDKMHTETDARNTRILFDNNVSGFTAAVETIEAQNILTSVQSNLFVEKFGSNITYGNKSDYKIDCLLSLSNNQGLWNNNSQIVINSSNIEHNTNLLSENITIEKSKPSEFKENYKTSFYNDKEFIKFNNGLSKTLNTVVVDGRLEKGLYAFNFNFNNSDGKELYIKNIIITDYYDQEYACGTLDKGLHVVAFYNPTQLEIKNVKISISNPNSASNLPNIGIVNGKNSFLTRGVTPVGRIGGNSKILDLLLQQQEDQRNILYLRNFGLFKVDYELDDPASLDLNKAITEDKVIDTDSFTWITKYNDGGANQRILSNIIFPLTFCFREKKGSPEDNTISEIGCLNEKYSGFLMLPEHAYLRIGGLYYINSNNVTAAYFDERSIPEDLKGYITEGWITEQLFNNNNTIIRHLNNE